MRWQGSGMNCQHKNSSTITRYSPTWEETNNRPNTRIGKQTDVKNGVTNMLKKKTLHHANDLAPGSCSSCQESPFQFEWIWIKRISHKGQVWPKQHFVCKSTGTQCSGLILPLSCRHYPRANVPKASVCQSGDAQMPHYAPISIHVTRTAGPHSGRQSHNPISSFTCIFRSVFPVVLWLM